MKPFFVYLLECADGSLYVGSTDDLEKRLAEHPRGLSAHTCNRRPLTLSYSSDVPTRDEARVLEHQLKGWSRAKKRALADGDFQRIHELARRPRRKTISQ